jgi:hypothetical protein
VILEPGDAVEKLLDAALDLAPGERPSLHLDIRAGSATAANQIESLAIAHLEQVQHATAEPAPIGARRASPESNGDGLVVVASKGDWRRDRAALMQLLSQLRCSILMVR